MSNKLLFRIHSWSALAVCLPLLVICLTGSVLVFKHEIDTLLMHDKVRVDPLPERQNLDTLLQAVSEANPSHEVVGWVLFEDPARADLVYLIARGSSDWSYLLLDQYRADILALVVSTTHYLTDWLLELHFTLLLHDAGLLLSGLIAVVLCLLGITGLWLHRSFWKNLCTLRTKARRVLYYSDLHKLVGAYASPVLLILGFTGAWWNLTHFYHELEEHADGAEHYVMQQRLYNDQLSLQALHDRSEQDIPDFNATYISLPWEPGQDIRFFGKVESGNPLLSQYASVVQFDAQSGETTSTYDIREQGLGAKTVDSYRRLHFGDFAGLPSRILWCLFGLAPTVLAFTGITLWLKRRPQRRRAAAKASRREQEGLLN
ncbi:putative iron-regulated membrane protein [Litorivivens lipolytica]|uniref:Putative iron-regulated membrane protein n=1 Tax=Litorivivens lipolytica TaxID=1524264 RepID=A0A7W4W5I7_9GAMM|nr:PepSY-associated TM helix domain-containing protein [Litorivivens lipolytica]MBB3047279.1 putative iron-regulated membrane protein [Litorivivens lipolytica]